VVGSGSTALHIFFFFVSLLGSLLLDHGTQVDTTPIHTSDLAMVSDVVMVLALSVATTQADVFEKSVIENRIK